MRLRIIKTKATDGVHFAVVDDRTGIVLVRGLDTEAEAEAVVREQIEEKGGHEQRR
jgi:hypothetical protein